MIERTTRGGSIRIADPSGPGGCGICGGTKTAEGQEPLEVTVNHVDALYVCGDCIATALAVAFGAAHVRAGGSLEDLDPPGRDNVWGGQA